LTPFPPRPLTARFKVLNPFLIIVITSFWARQGKRFSSTFEVYASPQTFISLRNSRSVSDVRFLALEKGRLPPSDICSPLIPPHFGRRLLLPLSFLSCGLSSQSPTIGHCFYLFFKLRYQKDAVVSLPSKGSTPNELQHRVFSLVARPLPFRLREFDCSGEYFDLFQPPPKLTSPRPKFRRKA